ncbi:hypothetical protein VNO78_15956 [Psophocarpus tetragonolobus]|uniref:Small EDRK-rich factor-like N-terminal domain-containing protein n=1 Tax=Psophocarpus tetragonolobus TaxID=3891 RepID=A0AAN9XK88_PSOTE
MKSRKEAPQILVLKDANAPQEKPAKKAAQDAKGRDAKAPQEKTVKKAAQDAQGNNAGKSKKLRGNQREPDREKTQARAGGSKGKQGRKGGDGLTPEQHKERDAKAPQEKNVTKKATQDAGGNNSRGSKKPRSRSRSGSPRQRPKRLAKLFCVSFVFWDRQTLVREHQVEISERRKEVIDLQNLLNNKQGSTAGMIDLRGKASKGQSFSSTRLEKLQTDYGLHGIHQQIPYNIINLSHGRAHNPSWTGLSAFSDQRLRGNQRERDRERAQARAGGSSKGKQGGKGADGLTPEQRRERDAKALQEKAAKKAAQDAGGNNAGGSKK